MIARAMTDLMILVNKVEIGEVQGISPFTNKMDFTHATEDQDHKAKARSRHQGQELWACTRGPIGQNCCKMWHKNQGYSGSFQEELRIIDECSLENN